MAYTSADGNYNLSPSGEGTTEEDSGGATNGGAYGSDSTYNPYEQTEEGAYGSVTRVRDGSTGEDSITSGIGSGDGSSIDDYNITGTTEDTTPPHELEEANHPDAATDYGSVTRTHEGERPSDAITSGLGSGDGSSVDDYTVTGTTENTTTPQNFGSENSEAGSTTTTDGSLIEEAGVLLLGAVVLLAYLFVGDD